MASKIRFYLDENVHSAVAKGLQLRGVDVITTRDQGMLGASDEAQLALANSLERVFFTHDADFLNINQTNQAHAGLAYAHPWTPIGDLVRGLLLLHDVLAPEEMRGRVEFL